ncbi:MAG: hypothetical protein LPK19_06245, partial [Hymenobacteraceae bacterium]|nr:hypothetical protein [Hymenobacteraceae bacterium]MDX5395803.1 hypothetical protein [Hymenobacteraceae bacterium]MDX5511858.1 hypothetical protein [Hymenobacteraceae bacterium]
PSDNLPVIVQDVSNRQVISGPFAPDPCQAVDTVYQYPRFTGNLSDVQNFGMPGLKLAQVTKTGTGNVANIGTADFNPYYERILPANTNDSYLTTVSRANGTFYTVWFGVSEMLPHILSGASCSQPLPNAAAIRGALTPVLDTLVKNNAKIAIGNIPDLTSFGLTRIADPIVLQNSFRQQLNNNNLNIWVQSSPSYQARRIDSRDILLPQAVYSIGTNGYGLDSLNPVVKEQVIDQIESGKINNYIRDYNGVVNALATGTRYSFSTIDRFKDNLILVDLNSLFKVLADRVAYNGVQYNADFVNGGVFSLDGFTLTPRGQAIVANEFIRSINKAYDPSNTAGGFGANIPRVNVNQYPGVVYP